MIIITTTKKIKEMIYKAVTTTLIKCGRNLSTKEKYKLYEEIVQKKGGIKKWKK